MKAKHHSKLTFTKAILIAVVVCSFMLVHFSTSKRAKLSRTIRKQQVQQVQATKVETAVPAPVAEIPKPAVVIPVNPQKEIPAPKKRFAVQKRSFRSTAAKKKLAQEKARRIAEVKLNAIIEQELAVFDISTDAVDIQSPTADLEFIGHELTLSNETFLVANHPTVYSPVPLAEEAFTTKEALVTKNDLSELQDSLAEIKSSEKELLVEVKEAPPRIEKTVSPVHLASNTDTTVESSNEGSTVTPDTGASVPTKDNDDDGDSDEPTIAKPETKVPDLSAMQATTGPELTSNQFIATSRTVAAKSKMTTQSPVTTQATSAPAPKAPEKHREDLTPVNDKLYGVLEIDSTLEKWLQTNKGHIELNLHQYGSKSTEDSIHLDEYRYPSTEFSYDSSSLEGTYQLIAAVYSNKARAPYLQITYPKVLNADNFKEKVVFQLKYQKEEKNHERRTEGNVLNITVFEAASGNYRQATPVEKAEVYIVGLESLGKYQSDKEGNIRMTDIPSSSEIILDVSAQGFYPTRKVVVINSASNYATVDLVEKQKVDTITNYFTKRFQDNRKSVVFGRVFNTENRKPMAGDEVYLSNRKGHALYFNAFPDTSLTASTSTGLFAFMNAEPAYRAIYRSHSAHALPLDLLPGYGYFADFGRGGKKSIRALVTDPVQNQVVSGTASTYGSAKAFAESNEKGLFEIKDIDLPAGNVTVEFRAKDYPATLYTLPWDTREATKTLNLYTLEKELIYESALSFARIRPEKHKGILVGGADASFFKGTNRCVRVELLDHLGKGVEEQKGPYLLYERSHPHDNFCLTQSKPGFAFYNLEAGDYILNWKNAAGKVLSSQVVRVGADRLSVVVR